MGGQGESVASCCAVFSILGVVHLLLFARMFSSKATSFALMGVERDWNLQQKSHSCYMAAVFYGIALLLSVLAKIYLKRNAIQAQ